MRGMTKHFRVIEGGKALRKDGLNEPDRRTIMAELRHIDGGALRPRYGRPALDRQSQPVGDKPRRSFAPRPRRRTTGDGNLWTIAPMTIALSLATFWGVWMLTDSGDASPSSDRESASFAFCHEGGGYNCVVDGDTLYYKGTKIRIADIDTPETHPPRCEAEAIKGAAATKRLQALVNAGPFSLVPNPDGRDADQYGRKLRIVTRGGESLGGVLVEEGLARWYAGGRRAWC